MSAPELTPPPHQEINLADPANLPGQQWTDEQCAFAARLSDDVKLRGAILRIATALGAQDPEGIVQEAIIKVTQADTSQVGPEHLRGYMLTTARNLTLNGLRRQQRQKELITDPQDMPGASSSPPADAGLADKLLVEKLMKYLSSTDQEILRLRFLEELSTEEIAEQLGLQKSSVRSRVRWAKRRSKKIASELGLLD